MKHLTPPAVTTGQRRRLRRRTFRQQPGLTAALTNAAVW